VGKRPDPDSPLGKFEIALSSAAYLAHDLHAEIQQLRATAAELAEVGQADKAQLGREAESVAELCQTLAVISVRVRLGVSNG
jgi:hypothetical protein